MKVTSQANYYRSLIGIIPNERQIREIREFKRLEEQFEQFEKIDEMVALQELCNYFHGTHHAPQQAAPATAPDPQAMLMVIDQTGPLPRPNVTTPSPKTELQSAPVGAGGASGGMVTDKAGPVPMERGLPTKDIATCFGKCYYSADNWPKRLSGTAWLKPARIGRGAAGGASAVWNPLTLAQLLHGKTKGDSAKEKLMKVLNSRFTMIPALGPWRDAFNEYFATHCTID